MLLTTIKTFIKILRRFIKEITLTSQNEIIIELTDKNLKKVLYILKYHTLYQFKMLIDITAIDYPTNDKRFIIVYQLLSIKYNLRIKIKILASENSIIPSIISIYNSANWYERETWDMFGIFFKNNKDLRRILTDYGFEGYPLRKDFPLSGYIDVRYDGSLKRVICEEIELTQEFRLFDFQSPWEKIN